ncbi:MAG: hypothetical protein H6500_01210 [Candidatus Woesearchaeota archaeon]|nr:MAG: hypothetical protein H6500_01210 [Candidatus Woesearchaeota archaeon]
MSEKVCVEEGIFLAAYSSEISKEMGVFYNPEMKLNRDISLLLLKNYFSKKISYCDPLCASGIRELRFLKVIPETFASIVAGDISPSSLADFRLHLKKNNLVSEKLQIIEGNALSTLAKYYYDCIELDPFGSPVPFLDLAIQRVKHNGVLSLTATDTAALCGAKPKVGLRRYGIKMGRVYFEEEFGVRNLAAAAISQGAKHDCALVPLLAYSYKHYYRIFFKVLRNKNEVHKCLSTLKYFLYDEKTQECMISDVELEHSYGKTFVGELNNRELLGKMLGSLDLLADSRLTEKLLLALREEEAVFGYVNYHKLQKAFTFSSSMKADELVEGLRHLGYGASRVHDNPLGIKTTAPSTLLCRVLKEKEA